MAGGYAFPSLYAHHWRDIFCFPDDPHWQHLELPVFIPGHVVLWPGFVFL